MSMQPVLFLDIDGVVNALAPSTMDWDDVYTTTVETQGQGWPISTSILLGDALKALDVEIRWLTTWRSDAYKVARLLGLPEDLQWVQWYHGRPHEQGVWGKSEAIQEFLDNEPGRPFLWAEDELEGNLQQIIASFSDVHEVGGPARAAFFVIPSPSSGLTQLDVAGMAEWVEAQRGGPVLFPLASEDVVEVHSLDELDDVLSGLQEDAADAPETAPEPSEAS